MDALLLARIQFGFTVSSGATLGAPIFSR